LRFVLQIPEIDVVLCGVNTLSQLEEIVAAAQADQGNVCAGEFGKFAIGKEGILNPTLWGAGAA
jgi:hypothetical protein